MSPQRLERVRTVLAAAVQIPMEERAAFLQSQCADDGVVLAEVEALLEIHSSAEEFLSHSLPELIDGRSELPVGTLLKSRYRIEQTVARSDFATVYFGAGELIGQKRVVIKIPDRLQDESALQATFASELHSLSRVQHPNVVGITDVGSLEDGKPFLVLTYVPGTTLREVIRRGPLSQARVFTIVKGIGRALTSAHKQEVWHLDLKPENIIVTDLDSDDERITLIDFGIARLKNATDGVLVAGSPRYMAPEQHDRPSGQCDIYSLALIAFELFTGHLPLNDQPIASQLPRGLAKSTVSALVSGQSAEPTERFPDVSQFVEELQGKRKKGIAGMLVAVGALFVLATAAYLSFVRSPVHQDYTKPVPIVATLAREHYPVFSPDGRDIYYAVGPDGKQNIYKKAIAGGDPVLVVDHPADDARPRVSPDGRQITFTRHNGQRADLILKRLSDGQEQVLVVNMEVESNWPRRRSQ